MPKRRFQRKPDSELNYDDTEERQESKTIDHRSAQSLHSALYSALVLPWLPPIHRSMRIHYLALAIYCLSVPAWSQTAPMAPRPAASAQQQADLARVEAYLNSLTTAQADFTFASPDGQIAHGVFYLNRPSRLRFEYTEPAGNLLIADGDYVIYWDAAQKEASNLPIDSTPLSFLLRPHISLSEGVQVLAFEHSAGLIRARLVPTKDTTQGSVTVAFSDDPLELRGWRLADTQGQVTDVTFANWKFGMALSPDLFHFQDPGSGKRHR
jgi:outer membrane lipoprotein-sorting protein